MQSWANTYYQCWAFHKLSGTVRCTNNWNEHCHCGTCLDLPMWFIYHDYCYCSYKQRTFDSSIWDRSVVTLVIPHLSPQHIHHIFQWAPMLSSPHHIKQLTTMDLALIKLISHSMAPATLMCYRTNISPKGEQLLHLLNNHVCSLLPSEILPHTANGYKMYPLL